MPGLAHARPRIRLDPGRGASFNSAAPAAPTALGRADPCVRTFILVWLAQVVATAGVQTKAFSLAVWLYQQTGSATLQGLVAAVASISAGVAAPLAGVVVDRWDRRRGMIAGHAGACACALLTALLYGMGALPPWAILALVAAASICNAIQLPALVAVMAALVPPERLGRANGLAQLGAAVTQILAPGAAAFLLSASSLGGVVITEAAVLALAMAILASIRLPPAAPAPAAAGPGASAAGGWQAIRARPHLLRLLALFAAVNFALGAMEVLLTPLVLGYADVRTLGIVWACGGVGLIAGSALLAALGGSRRPYAAIRLAVLVQGACVCLAALRPSTILIAAGALGAFFAVPLMAGLSQMIWQTSVPLELQGRVFAFRFLVAGISLPLAFSLAGPLVDRVFEPLLREGGLLASSAGRVIGLGPGRGAAALLVLLGAGLMALAALVRLGGVEGRGAAGS